MIVNGGPIHDHSKLIHDSSNEINEPKSQQHTDQVIISVKEKDDSAQSQLIEEEVSCDISNVIHKR